MCGGMCAGECGGGQEILQWEGERWKVFSYERSNWNTRGRGRIEERVGVRGDWEEECFLSVSLCTIETQLQYSLHVYAYTYTHAHTHTHTQNFQPQLLHKIKTSSSRSTLWTSWNLRPQARKNTGTYPVIPVCVCLSAHHEVYCIALHFHRNFFSQYFNKIFDPRYIVYIYSGSKRVDGQNPRPKLPIPQETLSK